MVKKEEGVVEEVWDKMGSTNKSRRRNALIVIVLVLCTIIAICYSGAIHVQIIKNLMGQ